MAANTGPRPLVVGPSTGPEAPYPLQMEGKVIKGFGRGSKELGIPTANLPVDTAQTPWIADIAPGAYFGWASLRLPTTDPTAPSPFRIYPMVMSIGYNPTYGNAVRSAEVHVLHAFADDFYGAEMRVLVAGFIRAARGFASRETLVGAIRMDIEVARRSLAREAWAVREVGGGTLDGSWLVRESA